MSKIMVKICGTLFLIGMFGMVIASSVFEYGEQYRLFSNISFGLCGVALLMAIWSIK